MFPTINIGALQLPVYPLAWGAAIFVIGALSFHRLVNGGVPAGHASRAVLLTIWGAFWVLFSPACCSPSPNPWRSPEKQKRTAASLS